MFSGFPRGGEKFFQELAAEQDRAWFAENKQRYESLWQAPMEELVAAFVAGAKRTFPGIDEVRPKVFRIHRDVRFARDKSPYKTHIAAHIMLGPKSSTGAYFHFGLEGTGAAMGQWMLEPDGVKRVQKKIAAAAGAKLAELVAAAAKKGYGLHSHEALKRVPAPYPQDHPRGELLKQKGIALSFPKIPKALLHKGELVDWLVERAAEVAPTMRWLDAAARA